MTKQEFTEQVNFALLGEPNDMVNDFIDYWTETSLNGKKMRFQKEQFIDIKRRFGTWKRFIKKKNDFVTQVTNIMTSAEQIFKQWENESDKI